MNEIDAIARAASQTRPRRIAVASSNSDIKPFVWLIAFVSLAGGIGIGWALHDIYYQERGLAAVKDLIQVSQQ